MHQEPALTALPQPARLMTIADYEALADVGDHTRTELQEGTLLMSPSPLLRHNLALANLLVELKPQLPADFVLVADIDVNLDLAEPSQPGTVRRPDLVVISRAEFDRVDQQGGLIRAGGTALAVEIISPGSRRMDNVIKRGEYADAGIPHYWIIDLDPPVSLVACHLAGEFGYQDAGAVSGVFETIDPFPTRVDLGALVNGVG